MSKSYSVGQVLYVVLKKDNKVFPVQIVEEITKRSISGESTSYMVKGGSPESQAVALDGVDGEIFQSADTLKSTLIARASRSINKIVDSAVARANVWYPRHTSQPQFVEPDVDIETDHHDETIHEILTDAADQVVILPDGTKAKVKSIKVPDTMMG